MEDWTSETIDFLSYPDETLLDMSITAREAREQKVLTLSVIEEAIRSAWSRLVGGVEIDLTRGQFTDGETIGRPTVAPRPPVAPPAAQRSTTCSAAGSSKLCEDAGMQTIRTPEDRFRDLPDFGYEPHHAEVSDGEGGRLRMAWVEAGPAAGPVVLCLHGEPSWSFLYRKLMPVLAAAGLRAVCPDLVGFGRSDKPTRLEDHSYARHVAWVRELAFDVLELRQVTMVGQDWGGLIGLRLAAEHPERFARLVPANTGLPTGDHPMPEVWQEFRAAIQSAPRLDIGRFVQAGCRSRLAPGVLAGYDAPFPDDSYTAGARAMPGLVPTRPDDPASDANRAAWARLGQLSFPALVAFSDSDPITGPMAPILRRHLPGARHRDHPVIANAGHFLQEDAGEVLGGHIVDFVRTTA